MIPSAKKTCSRIGLALFLMMLSWLVASMVLVAVTTAVNPHVMDSKWALWLLNDIPLYGVGLVVFLLVVWRMPETPQPQRPVHRLGFGRFVLLAVFCLGATYAVNLLSSMLLMAINALLDKPLVGPLDELMNNSGPLQNFLFGVCVPAIGEEFTFRYMLRRKMRGCGDGTYILFSGLCFGLFHGNLSQLFYAFVLGCVFAWAYLYTGRIAVPVALHAILNLFGIMLMPALALNEQWTWLAGVLMLLMVIGGIIVFVRFGSVARHSLRPPTEPGWPFRPPPARVNSWEQHMQRPQAAQPWTQQPQQPAPAMPPQAPPAPAQAAAEAAWQPPAAPAYGALPAAPQLWRHPYAQPPAPAYPAYGQPTGQTGKRPRFFTTCVLNPGMLLYLAIATLMIVISLIFT